MVGSKNGWADATREGKLLRRLVNQLAKIWKMEKDMDVDKFIKLAHCIANIALAKNRLAEGTKLRKDVDEIMAKLGMK